MAFATSSAESRPSLVGRTRALGVYTLGTNVSGYEVRLGSFMGPWLGVFGVETGPDFIYNQYTYNGYDIGNSLGVYVPLPQARMSLRLSSLMQALDPCGTLTTAVFRLTGIPQTALASVMSFDTTPLHSSLPVIGFGVAGLNALPATVQMILFEPSDYNLSFSA